MKKVFKYLIFVLLTVFFLILAIIANLENKGSPWIIGFIAGVLFGLIILTIYAIKNKDKNYYYDERQTLNRGICYKWGFSGMIFTLGLDVFIREIFGKDWASYYISAFLVVLIGTTVYALLAIFLDAYTYVNQNANTYRNFLAIIGVFNIVIAFINGDFLENGKLSTSFMNLVCGVAFLILFVGFIIKIFIEKKKNNEES